MNYHQIGNLVRKARKDRGWSQDEVAEKVGSTKAYVCDIEYGRRALGGDKAQAILALFNIKVDEP